MGIKTGARCQLGQRVTAAVVIEEDCYKNDASSGDTVVTVKVTTGISVGPMADITPVRTVMVTLVAPIITAFAIDR